MKDQPKHTFAQLYNYGEHQVLILKDFNDEEEKYAIKICIYHNNVEIAFKMTFNSEEARNIAFETIDEEKAGRLLNDLLNDNGIVLKEL